MSNVQIDRRPSGRYVALTRSGTWVDEQAMRNALRALASVPELSEEMRLTQEWYRAALGEIEEGRRSEWKEHLRPRSF